MFLAAAAAMAMDDSVVRERAGRSVKLLQKVAAEWKTPCLSCHHQVMPTIALDAARRRGIAVDENMARAAASKSFGFLADLDAAVQMHALIDPALSQGNALLAAHAAGIAPNLTTATIARHVARYQRAEGWWPTFDSRPPHSAGLITSTAVAARAIALYLPASRDAERRERLQRASRWLAAAKAGSTEDATFQLLGLLWTGAGKAETGAASKRLASLQRPDGGWGQLPAMAASDAYSTSEALTALRKAGLSRNAPAFVRGIEWLVRSQAPDGSWRVKSRIDTPAPVSPPYFESGFPYGHDQWLSCAATAWAVMALAEALPEAAVPPAPEPLTGVTPETQPWMETALFGSASEAAKLDPAMATRKGTTVLMMASDDPGKVRALLANGAKASATAESGYDALLTASLYPGNRETLDLLLRAGASAKARDKVKFQASPLPVAVFGGDVAMAKALLDGGADPERAYSVLGMFSSTPLAIAASMDYPEVIELLARRGAKLDALDEFGMTQVSWSALGHKDGALRTLLALGAKRTVKDKFGLTPLEHVKGIAYSTPEADRLLRGK